MKRIIKKVIIAGAGGRDFHNFLVFFKDNPDYKVVAFTVAQIPGIEKRVFPKELAGRLYKNDIPIYPEEKLAELIKKFKADEVVLAYSDLPYFHVMHKAALVNSCGANFRLMGLETMLKSKKPVIAVTAVRTGCGKSQTTRRICRVLKKRGKKIAVVRHPMPYGDLLKQVCQRFASYKDLEIHKTTIEEREEYEPLIDMGIVVYAGVDYKKILREAEKEANIIIWDGGNNDFPFFKPDLWIVLLDPLRPGHEITYYPGEVNLRMADVAIINKIKSAKPGDIMTVKSNIKKYNPKTAVIEASSEIITNKPELIRHKRVCVVEDGPTLTHGEMSYGAGTIAAKMYRAKIVDPRPYIFGAMKKTFQKYPHLSKVLPAMGYSREQINELEKIINKIPCDSVISGTPIDLRRIIKINKPIARIRYELKEITKPDLETIIAKFLKHKNID